MSNLLVVCISILGFFLVRGVICWYFQITKAIQLLEEQTALLRKLAGGGGINSSAVEQ